jgi:ABC-2 type transport system permease protein
VSSPGTLLWFAQHESRLAWRDWLAMMTAGRRRSLKTVVAALIVFAVFMHVLAYSMVGRFADVGPTADKVSLVVITSSLFLFWALMVSQAMESVTRAFYARSDLDLILTSPAASRKVFAVRIGTMALSIVLMSVLLAAPFINVLAASGGLRWIGTYGVVAALGFAAAAFSVALTIALFKTIGPKRTRFIAQIVAAVIGAAFVIGLQIGAILSYGTLSRVDILKSDAFVALAPEAGSLVYWPARAMLGDEGALAGVVVVGLILLVAAMTIYSPRFGDHAIAAAGAANGVVGQRAWSTTFRAASPQRALHRGAGPALTVSRPRVGHRYRHRRRVGHANPALVPQPGQAQSLPATPGLLAHGDLCGSILLDHLGGHCGARRRRHLARRDHGRDRARHPDRRAADQPAVSN